MNQHPAIVDNALRIVGSHARDMVQQVVEMSRKRVQQRVAGAMLRLAEQAGTEVADGIQIDFPVTRDDLAAMAGVTYFTISRTLSGWQRLGFVRNGRRRVTILAAHKLAQIANGGEP
jgi:CRP-like cAMP-binding protein